MSDADTLHAELQTRGARLVQLWRRADAELQPVVVKARAQLGTTPAGS